MATGDNDVETLSVHQLSVPDLSSRRRSSIFPAFLRRKSDRKDSIFESVSTKKLWPFSTKDSLPNLGNYETSIAIDGKFKFGWINGVYVSPNCNYLLMYQFFITEDY